MRFLLALARHILPLSLLSELVDALGAVVSTYEPQLRARLNQTAAEEVGVNSVKHMKSVDRVCATTTRVRSSCCGGV